jgi:hypothetical protein
MSEFLWTAFTGWGAAILFAVVLTLPYLLRRTASGIAPYRQPLWPHYWLGYLLPIVTFAHSWLPMSKGDIRGLNVEGLWLGTIALLLMLWQIALGLILRSSGHLAASHFDEPTSGQWRR